MLGDGKIKIRMDILSDTESVFIMILSTIIKSYQLI